MNNNYSCNLHTNYVLNYVFILSIMIWCWYILKIDITIINSNSIQFNSNVLVFISYRSVMLQYNYISYPPVGADVWHVSYMIYNICNISNRLLQQAFYTQNTKCYREKVSVILRSVILRYTLPVQRIRIQWPTVQCGEQSVEYDTLDTWHCCIWFFI